MSARRHFIVTLKEAKATRNRIADLFSVSSRRVANGIEALANETAPKDDWVLNFEEIGASSALLSDDDADKLRRDSRVAEVIEDFQVFALGPNQRRRGSMDPATAYRAGYERAMADLRGSSEGFGAATRFDVSDVAGGCPEGQEEHCQEIFGDLHCFCTPKPEPAPQTLPWNISMVRADQVWDRVTGAGVKVAVIDTGIADDHPDLTVKGGMSFVPDWAYWHDDHSHGSHCAGIIGARDNREGVVGVAPNCDLYAVKVLNSGGFGNLSWILAGMGWAAENGMDVASMSLGNDVDDPDMACILPYQRAAQRLMESGCVVIAAAGNSGREVNPWVGQPARCPGLMAVGAVDQSGQLADFSARGPAHLGINQGVEIVAPGVSIHSTIPQGLYGDKSGTSMACPHVAGAAALLKEQHPTWTPQRIRERLRNSARDMGVPGNDPGTGMGLLDCYRAVYG